MSKIFNKVPGNKVNRNVFNLSHERKMSMDMGKLVPFLCQEVVPGDTFRVDSEIMMRFAPMLAPVMHRVNVYTHFFYVPNRLVWNEWEDFITGASDPAFPKLQFNAAGNAYPEYFGKGSLPDYFGLPVETFTDDLLDKGYNVNALPFRAYHMIYNEWYRDQDLVDEIEIDKSSGIKATSTDLAEMAQLCTLRQRSWEKDYFTSARPWAQKGDAVNLPLQGEADLTFDSTTGRTKAYDSLGNLSSDAPYTSTENGLLYQGDGGATGSLYNLDVTGNTKVDLSTATATTINELRRAFQLQKWLERNARSGSRYTEVLRAHFGVKSSDSRLQRPEYLGGGRQPVSISEVLQTSQDTQDSALGDMAGHGISVGRTNRFKRFFEEHGYVIGIVSVLPRTTYQQGIPKSFLKDDKFDFFWPEFQHIGEQEIKNAELYCPPTEIEGDTDGTFGYTPRYAEYKYQPSTVHGDFRDNLKYWHLGRIFDNMPTLNEDFVNSNPDNRIFNVLDTDVHKLWVNVYNNVKAIRPMAVFGEPGLIDH